VEANQGRIWVESAPGQGAEFHLVLPTVAPENTRSSGEGQK